MRMGFTSLLPTIGLVTVVVIFMTAIGRDLNPPPVFPIPSSLMGRISLFLFVVVIAPIFETLMMGPILWVLKRIRPSQTILPLLSAAVWAGLHLDRAIYVAWAFYVFSHAYLAWRPRGWWRTVGVTASIHGFYNLLPGIAIAFYPSKS
jgi:hypothetical protein